MKVVIFGANGKTGLLLVKQALDKGYEVIAYVRRPRSIPYDHPKLKVVVGNLNETLRLRDAIEGADACISALGRHSLFRRSTVLIKGLINIVEAMKQVNVYRFIYLSSMGAGQSRYLLGQPLRFMIVNFLLRIPLSEHNANEELITDSNLNWTVIRPAFLTNGPASNHVKFGIAKEHLKGNKAVSRANLASFALRQLTDETFLKKFVWLCK